MYNIKIYVDHGYFQYEVSSMCSALEHAEVIMSKGTYRSAKEDDTVTIYKALKVKVCGEGLKSEFQDSFHRT